ncbi:MAG: hypothetical protein DRH17_01930 [Deltaproteobacteria bacterium]|nr:MAG: hypothetical protein DRH17_01930 [Deltaproteobacteria bacterium]
MKSPPAKEVCVRKRTPAVKLSSKALQVNLEATDRAITIDAKYLPLREVVENLPGLLHQTEAFLCELNHPFKNWGYVVEEMRDYALRNFSLYYEHPKGPQVVQIILNEWLDGLALSIDQQVQTSALENIISFVEKIMSEGRGRIKDCMPILSRLFERLASLPDEQFFLLASGYYQLKRIGQVVSQLKIDEFDYAIFNRLLRRTLQTTYQYWLNQEDPAKWFVGGLANRGEQGKAIFQNISHEQLHGFMEKLSQIDQGRDLKLELRKLLELPSFSDIVKAYQELPDRIEHLETDTHGGSIKKLLSFFKILETKGLASIHEEILGNVNLCLSEILHAKKAENIEYLLVRTFEALGQSIQKFPEAALQALENIGSEIFNSDDSDLVDLFIQHAIDLGFQYPELKGTTSEWKVQVNPAHVINIKVWLHLIEKHPKWSKRLISALIVNLKLAGLYIKDTDLFQKEISLFLNCDIAPVYNLAKQLAKLFPVYFNEINAEGRIRDVSTEIDEILNRKDVLIHFLRKQSHVESNNLLIDFTLEIINFWRSRDKTPLAPFVAPEILSAISERGPYVDGVHEVINALFSKIGIDDPRELLSVDMDIIEKHLSGISDELKKDKQRVHLSIHLLKLLDQKYNLNYFQLEDLIKEAATKGLPRTDRLEKALRGEDLFGRLQGILDYLKRLKQIILSPRQFKISEDIYRKRHIAADIPSMYGTYHERKFDALGLTFRLENLANILFEELIASINLKFLTRTTFFQIADCIHLLVQAMALDGIMVKPLGNYLNLLSHAIEVRRFSFTQYLDIFRGLSHAEQHILNTHFTSIHKENLSQIIRQLGPDKLLPKYHIKQGEAVTEEVINKVSEAFFREIVATTFGFQYLDNFVSKIIHTLSRQSEDLSQDNVDLLLSYDPGSVVSSIHRPLHSIKDPIYLGGKGYNLVRLAGLKMPIPQGFIITTEVFRCLDLISAFRQANEDLKGKILYQVKQLENETNTRLGEPDNPLLLSVRSGSTISLPGMMNTFLNVGINETIVEGLIRKTSNPWFAWDNYRRFLQSWGMFYNMERDLFDTIINEYKAKYDVERKSEFSPGQMREVALAYRQALTDVDVALPDDPYEQLFQAIWQVFYSWNSDKAKTYRDIMGISDDWGTAVIVQHMAYGNLDHQSGSGVVFTHNPHKSLDKVTLWGDYTTGNQGEDVVSGLVKTYSISLEQKMAEGRGQDRALEEAFPEIFRALRDLAKRLVYEKGWSAQEIEFTFEGPTADDLYILQSRDMVVRQMKRYPTFIPTPRLKASLLAKGVGVSGGALCGRIVFSLEDIKGFRNQEPNTPLILIRFDTVPDDIREISAADGLLTSRGGATSHASIVAHQLEKTCVVGCSDLMVYEKEGRGVLNGRTLQCGEFLSIDGQKGFVYKGQHEIQESSVH